MPTFGYWSLRGLAQPIRFLLAYTGEEHEEKLYHSKLNEDESTNREDWLSEKFTHGLDFPNLPYYIDGPVKITQSNAILKYIGEKHNLNGTTLHERALVNMLTDEFADSKLRFISLVYGFSGDLKENTTGYLENTHAKFTQFESFLGSNDWLVGNKITYVDFILFEILSANVAFSPTILDKHQNLRRFKQRVEELPAIQEYMSSSSYIAAPFNGPQAKWDAK